MTKTRSRRARRASCRNRARTATSMSTDRTIRRAATSPVKENAMKTLSTHPIRRAIPVLAVLLALPAAGRAADTQVTGEVDMGFQKRDVSSNEAAFQRYGE